MSRIAERTVETQRRFSQRGPLYQYLATYTTKSETDSVVNKYKALGHKVLTKPCKMGTRVYYAKSGTSRKGV